jgi:hypothetical protein
VRKLDHGDRSRRLSNLARVSNACFNWVRSFSPFDDLVVLGRFAAMIVPLLVLLHIRYIRSRVWSFRRAVVSAIFFAVDRCQMRRTFIDIRSPDSSSFPYASIHFQKLSVKWYDLSAAAFMPLWARATSEAGDEQRPQPRQGATAHLLFRGMASFVVLCGNAL